MTGRHLWLMENTAARSILSLRHQEVLLISASRRSALSTSFRRSVGENHPGHQPNLSSSEALAA